MQKAKIFTLSLIASACVSSAFGATLVQLEQKPAAILKPLLENKNLKEIRRDVDINRTTHIRLNQTYAGYPVFGGDVVIHIPANVNANLATAVNHAKTTLSGAIYNQLQNDLQPPHQQLQQIAQQKLALQNAIKHSGIKNKVSEENTKLIVYMDHDKKAHWAYLVSFLVTHSKAVPQKPTYILNAETFEVYEHWDDIQTAIPAPGGGFGGNVKMGKLTYDGSKNNFPKLAIDRKTENRICTLENENVTVRDMNQNDAVVKFPCDTPNSKHNDVFWSGELGNVNGAFSPDNDALYIGSVIKSLYQDWYNTPALEDENGPMMLNMRVHADMENAYWDGKQMTFGDGGNYLYPLVSLGVGAHEVSHGFTQQHSNLIYKGQPGGINESFSDMAAQAAEFYSIGKSSWQIGSEIMKSDEALRYMDEPTKDCHGGAPGKNCSIDNAKDFTLFLDVHYSSGVFNKAFHLLATSPNWDTRKAFDVMVQANRYYWTKFSNFSAAACDVVKATRDLSYPMDDVKKAFDGVGISTVNC